MVFSSFCARLIFAAADDDVAYGAAAAHNRAMAEFCGADDRLIGVAMVPLQDVARALAEIEQVKRLGLGAVWIAADAPGGRSPGHLAHEPIWASLAEARIPFILHVGSAPLGIGDEWLNDGRPDTVSARGGAEVIGSKDLTVIHFAAQRFVSALVLDGVLEAHRGLRGGIIEIGAGWVPDMIRRLDHAVNIWSRSEPQLARMQRRPSEQIASQLRFTPYPFEDVGQLVSESCAELYLFSSDYPHAEGGRDPIGRFTRTTARLSEADGTSSSQPISPISISARSRAEAFAAEARGDPMELFAEHAVIDVDTHVTEPADLWTSRVPANGATRYLTSSASRVVTSGSSTANGRWRQGAVSLAGYDGHPPNEFPPTYDEIDPSAYDAKARLAHMDREGIHAQVLYPTSAASAPRTFSAWRTRR